MKIEEARVHLDRAGRAALFGYGLGLIAAALALGLLGAASGVPFVGGIALFLFSCGCLTTLAALEMHRAEKD